MTPLTSLRLSPRPIIYVATPTYSHSSLATTHRLKGGSHSGLLAGAAMAQRPDLFKSVLCIAPVLDMLRYNQFQQCSNRNLGM